MVANIECRNTDFSFEMQSKLLIKTVFISLNYCLGYLSIIGKTVQKHLQILNYLPAH